MDSNKLIIKNLVPANNEVKDILDLLGANFQVTKFQRFRKFRANRPKIKNKKCQKLNKKTDKKLISLLVTIANDDEVMFNLTKFQRKS